jgi:hypothetical protein
LATLPRSAARAAQFIFVAVVLWLVWAGVAPSWPEIVEATRNLSPRWGLVVLSASIVFSAYLILIETWRRLMLDMSERIGYLPAARIWFISLLGRYIPGRVWSVAALAALSQRAGVSPITAAGSALLLTLLNTVVGSCLLLLLVGPTLLDQLLERAGARIGVGSAILITIVALAALVALPYVIQPLAALARRITRRDFHPPPLSQRSVFRSAAACAIAWTLYGIGFWVFAHALFDSVSGNVVDYIKVYTGSYLAGYVAIPTPAGFGVREGTLGVLLESFELMDKASATIVAWSSRIWLTALEVLPGVLIAMTPAGLPGRSATPDSTPHAPQH